MKRRPPDPSFPPPQPPAHNNRDGGYIFHPLRWITFTHAYVAHMYNCMCNIEHLRRRLYKMDTQRICPTPHHNSAVKNQFMLRFLVFFVRYHGSSLPRVENISQDDGGWPHQILRRGLTYACASTTGLITVDTTLDQFFAWLRKKPERVGCCNLIRRTVGSSRHVQETPPKLGTQLYMLYLYSMSRGISGILTEFSLPKSLCSCVCSLLL